MTQVVEQVFQQGRMVNQIAYTSRRSVTEYRAHMESCGYAAEFVPVGERGFRMFEGDESMRIVRTYTETGA